MSAWTVVPCLIALRTEFNRVSPERDRGADGTVGDTSHTSASDHTPDEDSAILRDHDPDSKNEVHALDIDSSGPWPGGLAWFDQKIRAIVEQERLDYESPTTIGRLQYVIWNGRIASRSWGWTWQAYSGQDQHTNHAHFSARYLAEAEASERPWGVAPVINDNRGGLDMTEAEVIAAVNKALKAWSEEDPASTTVPRGEGRVGGWIRMANVREAGRFEVLGDRVTGVEGKLDQVLALLAALTPPAAK